MKLSIAEIGLSNDVVGFKRPFCRTWLTHAETLASWLDVDGTPNADGVRKASHVTKTIALIALPTVRLLLCHLVSYVGQASPPCLFESHGPLLGHLYFHRRED